jgi:translation initiation factor 1
MKKNLFEMGANFQEGWQSDNKAKKNSKKPQTIKAPSAHTLHLAKEKRRGKVVTIVQPFALEKEALKALLKSLKQTLATGGAIKGESLEFQGEVSSRLKENLIERGYRFKK